MADVMAPLETDATTLATKRFMVVDDFSNMRRIVSGLLREQGVSQVVEAEDGVEALNKLGRSDVDFIISDWNMPNMTGLELLKAVRADEKYSKLPFLLITAEAAQGKNRRCGAGRRGRLPLIYRQSGGWVLSRENWKKPFAHWGQRLDCRRSSARFLIRGRAWHMLAK